MKTGADFVCQALHQEGVETIFGYPGGAVIPLFDAFYRDGSFNLVRTSHEQGATHAADGYARASGRPGVVVVTSGPGATNTLTGIATAYSDSVPLVVITGQVGKGLLGKNSFQEVDIVSISMPITKYNVQVQDLKDLPGALAQAFYQATSGRPGPVLVDITKNVFQDPAPQDLKYEVFSPSLKEEGGASKDQLDQLEDLIRQAKRPVIYAGGGVLKGRASQELKDLALSLNVPVVNSAMGTGNFDQTHPLSYGMVGMHGFKETNMLVYDSDLLLGIGVRFSDRAIGHREGFTKNSKVVHIDVDQREFNKNIDVDLQIRGDLKTILAQALDRVRDVRFSPPERPKREGKKILAQAYLEAIQEAFPQKTNVVTDVGQHQMWALQYWKATHPYTFFTSGGQGTMGYGMGAALGVKEARPDEPVILVTGDGSFRMNQHEVLSLAVHKKPVTIFVFDNSSLGMVRQWQHLFNESRYAETDIKDDLNYQALAQAYGVAYHGQAHSKEDLEEILAKVDPLAETTIIPCHIDPDDGVYPMVAAGSSINDIIEAEDII